MKLLIVPLVALMCVSQIVGQTNVAFTKANFPEDKAGLKNAVKEIKEGDLYYRQGRFRLKDALEHYLKANAFNPNNAELNLKIGHCYLYSKEKFNALQYLVKAGNLFTEQPNEYYLYLGKAYHIQGKWDEAIEAYKKYKSNLPSNASTAQKRIDKRIAEANNGKALSKDTILVRMYNLGPKVNTFNPEYGPVISADGEVLVFTSRRKTTTGGQMDPKWNIYYEDVYIAQRKDTVFGKAKGIGRPVNTEGHESAIGLSPDGQQLLLYKDDGGDGNIYICSLKGSRWSKPEKLNGNINSTSQETSAAFSPDGKTLYFVSDRPGGLGGLDIWYSKQQANGDWGKAENMGKGINTPYGEEGVYMHPDGKTLYFSSQGHNSMGGYDIFKSEYDRENKRWSEPENMGYPLNTPDDDVFFVMAANGREGYYSTIRKDGFGEKDLYRIVFPDTSKKQPGLTLLKGVIRDAKTKAFLEAELKIVNNTSGETVATFHSNSATGKYLVSLPAGINYNITATAKGYLFHSENVNIPASEGYQEVERDIDLNPIEVGEKMVLNNIFFDYDKATIRDESKPELANVIRLMLENPKIKVEISGHTDSKGSDAYNQQLSERRAKSVVDYLISKGIGTGRLIFKGYGETQPIANNETEEGRQMNRRTEFKILENQ